MEGSLVPKRHFDACTVDRLEPNGGGVASSTKRRHPSSSSTASSISFKPPPPPLKLSAGETLFRILCPAVKTGGVIGKGGAIIRQFREQTGAKIRIDESVLGCDERVILIVAETMKKKKENNNVDGNSNNNGGGESDGEELGNSNNSNLGEEDASPAQLALVRVFERMMKVDEERLGVLGESEDGEEKEKEKEEKTANAGPTQSSVVCRLLAPSNQVGCVLGRGGKIVEKIRQNSGAQVRILPKDHIPACASPGDELIQITGIFSAVKKALLSVSSCLQDNPRTDAANTNSAKPLGAVLRGTSMSTQVDQFSQRGYVSGLHAVDYHSRGSSVPGPENIVAGHRKVLEEEIMFRLLCQIDKVGSLIGKGGCIIRALQGETGASIKIADAAPDSDERVVVISARESPEQKHSPAQDAVLRVHSRIAEIGFEPGAAVVARLLVQSQQVGCLLGKGGTIVVEMRRATGASIRVFGKEQGPKCGGQTDDVVQVIGSLQSVQDALFHITSRLRETIFPMKPPVPSVGAAYFSAAMETPPAMFRSRHDLSSPGHYPSTIVLSHALDRPPVSSQPMDRQPTLSHGMDHTGIANLERIPYPYSSERPVPGPTYDRPSSPRSWPSQLISSGNPRGVVDTGTGLAPRNGLIGSGVQSAVMTSTTVEVVVPQTLLSNIYGKNNSNLNKIRQISGAKVDVQDPRPGATEGVVVVSGTPDQTRAVQSLIQAFIFYGQATP
ncbi:KH domain-containing protein HEN4 [Telopea speciosissima]|uniref:KH domain-containing protein HEN4 n=1 Tax=Telopea speciosissima TaxID=54955 RepID=UPI001CC7659E|nr:KH domain-containing protein HEN4 [Telopea speciosissima]XP_043713742.1 KH domain-containing protein HEN4 [Telopea speciosissima]